MELKRAFYDCILYHLQTAGQGTDRAVAALAHARTDNKFVAFSLVIADLLAIIISKQFNN